MGQWKHEFTEPPVDLRLLGSRPAEPCVFDPQVAVDMAAHGLETNVEDLIRAYNETPELVAKNRLEIARAYGRLMWLASALQRGERVREAAE